MTLHLIPEVGQKSVLGLMTGAENGMIKLTKLVIKEDIFDEYFNMRGTETIIHDGVWLFNPRHVWMVEHEKEIPTPGVKPLGA